MLFMAIMLQPLFEVIKSGRTGMTFSKSTLGDIYETNQNTAELFYINDT